jgi:23S rRNA (adenine-N6)-dimethyltransferase
VGLAPAFDEWARRIVADADLRPGELVIDIGAGHGALTRHLVEAEVRVLAVELHPLGHSGSANASPRRRSP